MGRKILEGFIRRRQLRYDAQEPPAQPKVGMLAGFFNILLIGREREGL